jgi:hypothetical protein
MFLNSLLPGTLGSPPVAGLAPVAFLSPKPRRRGVFPLLPDPPLPRTPVFVASGRVLLPRVGGPAAAASAFLLGLSCLGVSFGLSCLLGTRTSVVGLSCLEAFVLGFHACEVFVPLLQGFHACEVFVPLLQGFHAQGVCFGPPCSRGASRANFFAAMLSALFTGLPLWVFMPELVGSHGAHAASALTPRGSWLSCPSVPRAPARRRLAFEFSRLYYVCCLGFHAIHATSPSRRPLSRVVAQCDVRQA